ncbi:hypothetical protein MMC28_007929 [Mycoblastus sanguinarius]|nr:hypothetical protein [Mycoblastus sanguinarius]
MTSSVPSSSEPKRRRSSESSDSSLEIRPISPPPLKRDTALSNKRCRVEEVEVIDLCADDEPTIVVDTKQSSPKGLVEAGSGPKDVRKIKRTRPSIEIDDSEDPTELVEMKGPTPLNGPVPSPMQLNSIEGLPAASNKDTLRLRDILGDPLIRECWLFNYLFDMDFVMKQFDSDTRDMVQVQLVHGSWKDEDRNRIGIEEATRRYSNVKVTTAYMPEAYGTHHSKMMILFRHDDSAQVILLTGNLIERDWRMSQAIWRTPLLPLQIQGPKPGKSLPKLGTGHRFKHDLLAYFRAYGPTKLQDITTQLQQYDFTEVRGALIASVPGKQGLRSTDPETDSRWGWPSLKRILSCIPTSPSCSGQSASPAPQPHTIAQVSSVASIGENWLSSTFIPALSATAAHPTTGKTSTNPKFSLIFPTAEEIRRSVNGYEAGASIHMKTQSPAQAKQVSFLRPMLCHWAGERTTLFSTPASRELTREAGRGRAAPHIKTYIRFSDPTVTEIHWAMMTSANLSTQAWGGAQTAGGEVRICSYEIGVVIWPALWEDAESGSKAKMVPVFKGDTPMAEDIKADTPIQEATAEEEAKTVIGFRMPYSLPLHPYTSHSRPWCASEASSIPDHLGRIWPGNRK